MTLKFEGLTLKNNGEDVVFQSVSSIEDGYIEPELTEHEINTYQRFVFVSIDEAILANELHMQQGCHWVENPTYILKLLKNDINKYCV